MYQLCWVCPNITGSNGTWLGDTGTPFGAFIDRGYVTGNGGGSGTINRMGFDASLSSSLYGAASTVQPQSLRFISCIKF